MSLALLRFTGRDQGGSHFRFDIGKNRYYRWAVGDKASKRPEGLRMFESPRFQSRLLGPLPERSIGRGVLTVPDEHFDRENRMVQLMSFRTQQLIGPAVSDPVQVPAGTGSGFAGPALGFSRGVAMHSPNAMETVPFRYSEAKYSNAMFLGALANILPTVLPKVAPFVGNILGGLFGGGGGGSGAAKTITKTVGDPKVVNLLSQLLKQIDQVTKAGGAAAPAKPVATPAKPTATPAAKALARRSAQPYSEAQVAPALLAALPALVPLLQKVLTPETIKTVLDQPAKMAQVPINAIKDIAKLGLASHEQDLAHLRAIHPSIDDPTLNALLQSLSLGFSESTKELQYRRVDSVELGFADVASQDIYGGTRVLYRHGTDLGFPLDVKTPRAIKSPVVEVFIKDAETLEVLARQRLKIEGTVESGRITDVPTIAKSQLQALEAGRDYLVCTALVWKNKKGQRRGTSRQQLITIAGEYAFDRVEEAGQLTPLSDLSRDREFWHKLWQGSFSDGVKRFEIACKYYYVLNPKRADNARLETVIRLEEGDRKKTGKLKSGMELSPTALNRLIPRFAPDRQPLQEPELAALRSKDFIDRFNQAARYNAKLRGRTGDSAALWLFPEMKMQTVVLQRASEVNVHGNVTGLEERRVAFPMPGVVHFIGARTT